MQIGAADSAANAPEEKPKRRAPHSAWKPGQSGNPAGKTSRYVRMKQNIEALTAELGGSLTASQTLLVRQVSELQERARAAPPSEVWRIGNSIVRALRQLGIKPPLSEPDPAPKPKPPGRSKAKSALPAADSLSEMIERQKQREREAARS